MSIKNLRFISHPILPLVYDDSLSYYEVLCKVVSKVNECIEAVNELEDIGDKVTALETSVTTINNTITSMQTATESLEARVSANETNISKNTDDITALYSLIDDINADIKTVNETVENYYSILNAELATLDEKVDNNYQELHDYTDQKMKECHSACVALINALSLRVKELERIIQEVGVVDVFNYSANQRLTLDKNNWKLYTDLENAISAEEYCSLNLSADDYAKYDISAIDYLRDSKKLLHFDWVYEPILGYRQGISNVLTGVVNYFFGTINADTYAGLNLNADGYAELGLTATEYRSYDTVPYGYNYESIKEIVQNIVDSGEIESDVVNNLVGRVTALEGADTTNKEAIANNTANITTLQTTAVLNNGTGITSEEYSKLNANL